MPGSDAPKNAQLTPAPVLPPGPDYTEQHLDVDQVLKDELVRLRPDFKPSPIEPGSPQTKEDVSPALARDLFGQNLTALCFSGGGIRSASFCLGILQALARTKAVVSVRLSFDGFRRRLHRLLVIRVAVTPRTEHCNCRGGPGPIPRTKGNHHPQGIHQLHDAAPRTDVLRHMGGRRHHHSQFGAQLDAVSCPLRCCLC